MDAKRVLSVVAGVVVVLVALSANAGVLVNDNLISWYKIEPANYADDCRPANNDGTIVGATWSDDKPTGATMSTGSLSFDGNDYVNTNSKTLVNSATGTVEAWFKTSASGGTCDIVGKYEGNPMFELGKNSANKLYFFVRNSTGNNAITLTSTATINNGAWHHAAVAWDSSGHTLYLDGASAASDSIASYYCNGTTNNLWIGARNVAGYNPPIDQYWTGLVDEVRFYNVRLTSDEISQNYNAMFESAVPEPAGLGLIGMALLALRRRRK